MDIRKIINTHKKMFKGIEYVYLPLNNQNNTLIIVLATHNQKNYMLAGTFLNNQKSDLLFLKDENNTYYFGNDISSAYEELLESIIKNYDRKRVFFIGASMSGYASIRFALLFNSNCFSCNPQVDLNISKNFSWKQLTYDIDNIQTQTTSLEPIIKNKKIDSVIYIMSGHHNLDAVNRKILLDYNYISVKIISHIINSKSHEFFIGRNIDYLYKIIDIITLYRDLSEDELVNVNPLSNYEAENLNEYSKILSLNEFKENSYLSRFSIIEKQKLFYDIGKYDIFLKLKGLYCIQKNKIWYALHESKDNLLVDEFNFNSNGISDTNNDTIYSDWSFRNSQKNKISYATKNNTLQIEISNIEDKYIYIQKKISIEHILSQINTFEHKNVYLTLHAKVITSKGSIYCSLGGFSTTTSWHHSNSNLNNDFENNRCICTHYFKDLTSENFVFIRFNLSSDLIDKVITISDLYLTVGFIPLPLLNY